MYTHVIYRYINECMYVKTKQITSSTCLLFNVHCHLLFAIFIALISNQKLIYFLFIFFFSGNVINIQSGKWVGLLSGLGAGLDSFFEYMLKVSYGISIK